MLDKVPALIEQEELSTLYTLYREELAKLRGESEEPQKEQSLDREDYLVADQNQPTLQSEVFLHFTNRGDDARALKHSLREYFEAKRKGYDRVWMVLPKEDHEKGNFRWTTLYCVGEPYCPPDGYHTSIQCSGVRAAEIKLGAMLANYFHGCDLNPHEHLGIKKQGDARAVIEGIVAAYLDGYSRGKVKEFRFDLERDKVSYGSDVIDLDVSKRRLSYGFFNDRFEMSACHEGSGREYGNAIAGLFNDIGAMEKFYRENPRLVFDLIFPDNHLEEVLAKIEDGSLDVTALETEKLWLMIANPKPLDKTENGNEPSKACPVDWSKYPEIAKLLSVEVYRDSFRKRSLQTSSLHPDTDEENKKVKKLTSAFEGSPILAYFLNKFPPNFTEWALNRVTKSIPIPIEQLHQTLMDIEEMMKIAKDMNELGSDDPEWKAKAEEITALYSACLRVLPSILREIELKLRHPNIQIALGSFGQLVNEIALNPIHKSIAAATEGEVREISNQQRAGREVAKLTD